MNQKKFFQIAGIAVAFVWVFCLTLVISTKIANRNSATTVPSTNPPATTANYLTTLPTTAPSTTQPSTSAVTAPGQTQGQDLTIDANNITVTVSLTNPPSTTSIQQKSKEELVSTYVDAINNLKNSRDFTMTKSDSLDATIDDITGGTIVSNFVQKIIDNKKSSSVTYNFQSGYDAATGQTPITAIAPLGAYAKVDPNAVTSATANNNSDGGYTIILTLQDEEQTESAPAANLSTMVEVIDVNSYLPSGATLNTVSIKYTATTVKATFDSQGRLASMEHYLSVSEGGGTGKMAIAPISVKMHGKFTSNYSFIYP